MSEVQGKRLVVVLGMHRSGTSAITKSLELLGVRLGTDLHPAGVDNPKGFWEDRKCLEINNSLLKHLGSAYDSLSMVWDAIPLDLYVAELKASAVQYIAHHLNENGGIWGFKDPRTCRLLGFWNEVFSELNCEVSYIVVVRNPASVAASMASRNAIPAEKTYYLWLQHVLPAMKFIKSARQVVVDYDEFLADPYSQLVRISANLNFPLPGHQDSSVKNYESNFLENGLRHTRFTEAELAQDTRASTMVIKTYNLLLRLAKDQEILESPNIQASLHELYDCLKAASPACEYISSLENEQMNLNNRLRRIVALEQSSPLAFSEAQISRIESTAIHPGILLKELVLSLARAGQHKAVANIHAKLAKLNDEGVNAYPINSASEADLKYKIDLYQDGYFRGWILDRNRPLKKLTIEIIQAQQVIARGVADLFRRDLAAAEFGDGCCAFKLKADVGPTLDGGAITLRVVELDKVFEVQPTSIRGVV